MKKFATIILALLLVVGLMTGCGPKKPEKLADAKIVVQAETEWLDYYNAAAKRIKDANPGCEVEIKEVASFTHLETLEQTDAQNKDVADVFAIPADRLVSLAEKDLVGAVDAQAIAKKLGGWKDFDAGLGGLFKLNNEYRAFPFNIETLVVFANVKNAEAEGIDLSKPAELNDVKKPEHILLPVFNAWFGVALTNAADIALLKQDGDKFVSDLTTAFDELAPEKKAAMESLYKYWKFNADSNTALFDKDAGWGYIDAAFTSGGSGVFRIGGPWELGGMKEKTADGKDLGIYPIGQITVNGKPFKHWQGGWGLALNPRIEEDPAKVALANAMIAEIVNPEFAVDLFKATGKILENVSNDVYAKSDLGDIDKKMIEAVIASYQVSPGRPLFKQFGNVWDTWQNGVISWNSVKPADAASAYSEIKASFDAMMADLK